MSRSEVTGSPRDGHPDADWAAEVLFSYLSETDPLRSGVYDAVMGFGMFDLSLPRFAGDLYAAGRAARIVFTGGIGAGTGNLGGPEADVWRAELTRSHPRIRATDVITENRSTNTGENVDYTARLLGREHPDLAFGAGIKRVIVVASPTRMRRVWLTLRRQQPALDLCRQIPAVTRAVDGARYAAQGVDHVAHMLGELDRIERYPARGWIAADPLPVAVLEARTMLTALG